MRHYRTPQAFRRALAAFVERGRDELRVPLEVLRRRIVFPRFLARLLSIAPDSWVLTGGMALDLRLMQRTDFQRRTTVDLDFLFRQTRTRAEAELIAATQVDLHDYFVFTVTPTAGAHTQNPTSLRYNAVAYIGTVPYLTFALDVGMVDPLRLAPEHLVITPVIAELGWEPLRVPILPLPHQVAEKVHALTRTLRDGTPRTRVVKDLADLVLISMIERPAAAEVRMALEAVFRAYNTHPLPGAIPTTPVIFEREFRSAAEDLGITTDLAKAEALAGEFLNPILQGTAQGIWDPTRRCWADVSSS